jgi:peptide/nickel transport system substrate-binding protein
MRQRGLAASAGCVRKRLAAALLGALALAACTRVGTQTSGRAGANPWTKPGRLVFAETGDAKSLNPMLASTGSIGDLSMFLFSYAVRYDGRGRPVPDALRELPTLENGDVSRDGLTLKYKLRPNVYFHDGVRLTCRDLAFTWRAVINPRNNDITHDGYRDIRSIDCTDPLVAIVHMRRAYAPFLQQLWGVNGNAAILPEHLLEKVNDSKGSFNTAAYQAAPIGSGPFKFVRWDRGQDVELEAYDKYFMGRPKLDRVIFKIVPDDSTLVAELKTHEIDMAARLGSNVWRQVQHLPGTVTITVPSFEFDHIDFNLRRPLFADVRMRRALALAVDRRGIIAKISHGNGDLAYTALSPVISSDYDPHVAHYDYDPAAAKKMLDVLGWKLGPDGVRVKGGQRLAFTYATQTESVTGRAIEAFVQRAWHDIGADVSVKNQSSAQFFDNTANGVLQGGKYDVAGFAWVGAADPDDSAIYSGHNMAPAGQNALYWNDPVATKAMDDGLATVDPRKRRAASWIEQERFAAEVPSIILDFRREIYSYNSDLKNFKPSPVISAFWNPQDISL